MNRDVVLSALRAIDGLPQWKNRNFRSIYETGDNRGRGTGEFQIDFASFPGGTTEEVPRRLIDELEREGVIVRAYAPHINAWKLAAPVSPSTKKDL
jgi:hypothetical protein